MSFKQDKYQVCKFRIHRHFIKSVNGSSFPVLVWTHVVNSFAYRLLHIGVSNNISKTSARVSSGVPNTEKPQMKARGRRLYQLSYEATHWDWGQFIEFISHQVLIFLFTFIYNRGTIHELFHITLHQFTPHGRCELNDLLIATSHLLAKTVINCNPPASVCDTTRTFYFQWPYIGPFSIITQKKIHHFAKRYCNNISIKAGVHLKAVFWLRIMFCMQISRSRFKLSRMINLSAHPTYLCFGSLCKFFGDFLVYLEINSFSQRISKIYGNRKYWRFGVVLKLNFEAKNW